MRKPGTEAPTHLPTGGQVKCNNPLDLPLFNKYIAKELYEEEQMQAFLSVMKALSDPNRIRILKMLQHKKLCVCEIKAALGVAQPTASKHLKVLEKAALVRSEKDGLWVNYYLADGRANPFVATLLGNLRHWLEEEPDIVRIRELIPSLNREKLCSKQSSKQRSCIAGK